MQVKAELCLSRCDKSISKADCHWSSSLPHPSPGVVPILLWEGVRALPRKGGGTVGGRKECLVGSQELES